MLSLVSQLSRAETASNPPAPTCQDVIHACDKALEAKNKALEQANGTISQAQELLKTKDAQIKSKQDDLDSIQRNPWFLMVVGAVAVTVLRTILVK